MSHDQLVPGSVQPPIDPGSSQPRAPPCLQIPPALWPRGILHLDRGLLTRLARPLHFLRIVEEMH